MMILLCLSDDGNQNANGTQTQNESYVLKRKLHFESLQEIPCSVSLNYEICHSVRHAAFSHIIRP